MEQRQGEVRLKRAALSNSRYSLLSKGCQGEEIRVRRRRGAAIWKVLLEMKTCPRTCLQGGKSGHAGSQLIFARSRSGIMRKHVESVPLRGADLFLMPLRSLGWFVRRGY